MTSQLRLVLGFLEDADIPEELKPLLKSALIAESANRPASDFERIVDGVAGGSAE